MVSEYNNNSKQHPKMALITIRYKLSKSTLNQLPQYSSLVAIIEKQFFLCPDSFHITYIDEDQDHISITNQNDITTMIETTQTLELYIHDKQEVNDTVIDDNLLNLSIEDRNNNIQERVKKNMEEYLNCMEKMWDNFQIKDNQQIKNQIYKNDFMDQTIQLVESQEISISKQINQGTTDLSQQTITSKTIDEKIQESIPLITSIVQNNIMKKISPSDQSSLKLMDRCLRLKHKRIGKVMEKYPQISLQEITLVVEDSMDLEYDELLLKISQKWSH